MSIIVFPLKKGILFDLDVKNDNNLISALKLQPTSRAISRIRPSKRSSGKPNISAQFQKINPPNNPLCRMPQNAFEYVSAINLCIYATKMKPSPLTYPPFPPDENGMRPSVPSYI